MSGIGQAVLWAINGFTEESVRMHLPVGHRILRSFPTEWKTAYVVEGPDLVAPDTPLFVDIIFTDHYPDKRRTANWAHRPSETWDISLDWAA